MIQMKQTIHFLIFTLFIGWTAQSSVRASEIKKPSEEQIRFFETKIRPLLVNHCIDCHGEDEQESDLRLDTLAGMLKGGKAGTALIPGKPESSLMITAITYKDADLKMPPEEKLSKEQIADLSAWVKAGAPHPEFGNTKVETKSGMVIDEEAKNHWAFQPVNKQQPPKANPSEWIQNPIDAFVLKQLNEKKLTPAKPADKRTLIRRATFDLTGLPPTPEEIEDFLNDNSPDAFSKVIDRLLESPHYGERWGRHWLDVARYADSNGLDENIAHGNAWRYRDYVVNSFNNDKPYNQFITEQLAGDLLPKQENWDIRNERMIATGFLSLGPKVLAEVDETKMEMDIIDEQVDTISRSLIGITMGCARCHDHKFDPFGQDDYYALAGIFKSTKTMEHFTKIAKWNENVLSPPETVEKIEAMTKELATLEKEKKELLDSYKNRYKKNNPPEIPVKAIKPQERRTALVKLKEQAKQLDDKIKKLKENIPEKKTAMSVLEGEVRNIPVHIRGSHLTLGETVQRGFPAILTSHYQTEIPEKASGRLQLVQWLTHPEHPLTYRVFVNRIWRWHFGEGIVRTTDNFGLQGEKPTNQPLLDWLTTRFIENNYSIKEMHRLIMLSNTWQMSSDYHEGNAKIDPANRFLWRRSIRRLEAEAIRDSLLFVSNSLVPQLGGSILNVKNREFVFNHESKEITNYNTNRRSIYLPVIRNHIYSVFQLFDYSDASMINGNRGSSTVSTQALFLMNSEFVNQMTTAMAKNLLEENSETSERIKKLYRISYAREPDETELTQASLFLEQFPKPENQPEETSTENLQAWQALCQAIVSSNEFIYLR